MFNVLKNKDKKKQPKSLPLASVSAHYRSGSFVKPYIRTHADGHIFNNFSYRGNKNGY